MKKFEELEKQARDNGDYRPLVLDDNNNKVLELLSDGVTAVVLERKQGCWVEVARFNRESYWTGGYWSDVDIDNAIYN